MKDQWKYLYRAIDTYGIPADFLLTAKRDRDAAKRFFRKAFKNNQLVAPISIETDGALTFPQPIETMVNEGILPKEQNNLLIDIFI